MRGTRLSLHWPALVFQPLLPPLVSVCPSNPSSSSWRVDPSVGRSPPGTRSHQDRFYMPLSPLCVLARNTLLFTWHPAAEGGWQLHSTKLTFRALGSVNCDCITYVESEFDANLRIYSSFLNQKFYQVISQFPKINSFYFMWNRISFSLDLLDLII